MNIGIKELLQHRAELGRALRNFHFEHTDDGRILLAQQGLFIGGAFTHTLNGADKRVDPNLYVNEGLMDVLAVYFTAATAPTGFSVATFINNVAPVATLTAATFTGTMGEFTNYTQSTRPAWTPGAPSAQTIGNSASVANFTINTGGGSVWGAALIVGANAKSATSGKLAACTQFTAQRSGLLAGDTLAIEYDILAQST
jgi:hypothetical protein